MRRRCRPARRGRGVSRSQEAETVLQDFDHAFTDDVLTLFRLSLEDREDEVLFSQPPAAFDFQGRGHFGKLRGGLALEFREVHQGCVHLVTASGRTRGANCPLSKSGE